MGGIGVVQWPWVWALAGAAGVMSYAVTWVVRLHAHRLGLIDVPNVRSLHTRPTPRAGGLGIVVATVIGGLLLPLAGVSIATPVWAALLLGGTLIAVVSLVDDIRGVPAPARLLLHLLTGCLAVALVDPVQAIGLPGLVVISLGPAAWILSVVWIAGLTNAFNFMDGIDGLAAGQAMVTACGGAVLGWAIGRPDVLAFGLVVAAAASGFVLHNWSPARVFMGDVGSAFLGYVLAVLMLLGGGDAPILAVAGVLLVWPFVFDPVFTLIRRAVRRENVLAAHRSHLYQRLVASGWGHQGVALGYLALASVTGTVAVLLAYRVAWAEPVALVGAPLSVLATWGLVRWREQSSRL